jgi:hypothetical protein
MQGIILSLFVIVVFICESIFLVEDRLLGI